MAEMDYFQQLLEYNDFYAPEVDMVRNNYKEMLRLPESEFKSFSTLAKVELSSPVTESRISSSPSTTDPSSLADQKNVSLNFI